MAEIHLQATFIKGASKPEHFPVTTVPEIAMIGRSNVGKSSLINAIVRNSAMAKVSNTPGKTREINFFATDIGIVLVDLPGYGYASVSKAQRQQFAALNKAYLFDRRQCKLVCVLLDGRIDPQAHDLSLIEELELAKRRFLCVITKTDKLSKVEAVERHEQIQDLVKDCAYAFDVVSTSAKEGEGRSQLIGIMKKIRDLQETPSL